MKSVFEVCVRLTASIYPAEEDLQQQKAVVSMDQNLPDAETAEGAADAEHAQTVEEGQVTEEEEIDHQRESEKEGEFIQRIADAYQWPS
ncbi:hypothetical protein FRC14_005481 [Serendipita sp. 396]|nr:hypothetical protein FRC14_005481 [Serendipita sp. 396]KAG8774860.1 hypothetical protein FRC15_000944 [Serendipita sp. 397]KAG8825899.1 hypothetical protein FRC19_010236 [Serendipita sp. 401]KAG8866494.1 hypothetical protein FRC20_008318 [Serendipita sp. 405]KAG9055789.1 hypothetical protein FS842_001156 [Serendipita sp. 407]